MLSLLLFTGMLILLCAEGYLASEVLFGRNAARINMSLALPLASLLNVLLVFCYTVTDIRLTLLSIGLGHAFMLGILLVVHAKWHVQLPLDHTPTRPKSWKTNLLSAVCGFILLSSLVYSFTHAILLPTFQYDSATNWTMRSEISFYDQHMAFDPDETRGMAKPQYPFLFHALQITANQGQASWNDHMANAILYLLQLGCLIALYLLLRLLMNQVAALATITAITSVPLFDLHLAQGYGDITLVSFALLACTLLFVWIKRKDQSDSSRFLFASALFILAGAWTKSEGLFFGLIPWLAVVSLLVFLPHPNPPPKGEGATLPPSWERVGMEAGWKLATLIAAPVVFILPWIIFTRLHHLGLTPHGSDTRFAWHPEGLKELIPAVFGRGSFGMANYGLMIAGVLILALLIRKDPAIRKTQTLILLWPLAVLMETLFVYLFTPNVVFLLNAEAFYRQMMLPVTLAILCFAVVLEPLARRTK